MTRTAFVTGATAGIGDPERHLLRGCNDALVLSRARVCQKGFEDIGGSLVLDLPYWSGGAEHE